MTKPKIITFDCYGTLIDWMGGVRSYLSGLLKHHGRKDVDLDQFVARWERIQFSLLKPYRPYSWILGESLTRAAKEYKLDFDPHEAGRLSGAMGDWLPFPDVKPALTLLAQRFPLALISNTDRSIMNRTRDKLGIPLSGVVVAEDLGCYKPDSEMFEKAFERLSVAPSEVLHVSFSFEYDLTPARALGAKTAWLRRPGTAVTTDLPVDVVLENLHSIEPLFD